MSMRGKTTLLIILVVFVTTATTFFAGLYFTTNSLKKTVEQDLEFAIGIANNLVGTKMDLLKSEAATIVGRLSAAVDDGDLQQILADEIDAFPDVSALAVFDRSGIIASYSDPLHDHDLDMHSETVERAFDGAAVISSPFYCSQKGEYVMNVYTPVDSDRLLAMTIPGLTFSEILSEHKLWETGDMFMLNEVGTFIGAADEEIVAEMNNYMAGNGESANPDETAILDLISGILSSESGVANYTYKGEEYMCAYSEISTSALGWRVAVTAKMNESPQADAQRGQLYAVAISLAIGAIAAIFLSWVIAQPFRKIEAQNRDLEKLNETIREQTALIMDEHERIQLMLDATPLASRLWNRDIEMIECNEAAVKLFNLKSKQEYMDKYFSLSPEYQPDGMLTREKVRKTVEQAFEKGVCTFHLMYQMADGTPIPAEVTMVRVPYENDFVVAAYSRDLREQQKMLHEIEQRDQLLRTVNLAADILLRSDHEDFSNTLRQCMEMMATAINADRMHLFQNHMEGDVLYCSQLFEWSGAVAPLQNTSFTMHVPFEKKAPMVLDLLSRGESVHSLVRDLSPAGQKWLGEQGVLATLRVPIFVQEEFWGFVGFDNCHSEELFDDNQQSIMRSGALLVANALLRNNDMLNIRDTSAKLQIALEDAKEANNAKSDFLAHMSHEIRTPLNAVVGLSELILDDEKLSAETENKLEKIHGSGMTILSIINDILDISKIESGKFDLNPIQYDTPSLINDTVTLNIVRIGEKPIRFVLYVDENLPGALYGDDLRVKQIFNNLLSNAFKYTNAGEVEWRISFERNGDDIWLVSSVRDTGIGILPEDIEKLFLDYNQVDTKTNRKVEGTGLGLSITKRLAKMMDGDITVESEYGKGSTFRIRVRQAQAPGAPDAPIGKDVAQNLMNQRYTLSKHDRNTKLVRADMSYAHVLVVDDIETNLDVVRGMMKPYNIKIDCATSGLQAIEMIRAENPRYTAVFMDHMMPGMDGIEATRIIREDIGTEYAKNIPIIALTANAIVGNEEMFLSHGFQAFISKPIDMMKLDSVLRKWVRNKSIEKELSGVGAGKESAAATKLSEGLLFGGLKINGIDLQMALERFGGDESVLLDVLRSYAQNTPPLLQRLSEYLEAENLSDYAIAVHGIKGSSYGIFAQDVGSGAEALELSAKAKDLDSVKGGHDAFESAAAALLRDIEQALALAETSECKAVAAAPDPALLAELRAAAGAFDMDGVDRIMEKLRSFKYESGGHIIPWLGNQIGGMNFEEISNGEWPEK